MQSKRLLNLLSQYDVNVDCVLSNEILMHYNGVKYKIYYSVTKFILIVNNPLFIIYFHIPLLRLQTNDGLCTGFPYVFTLRVSC